ncbi:MAG: hypothetical protein PVJ52_03205 [Candidatus Woesebacteria bacterium]
MRLKYALTLLLLSSLVFLLYFLSEKIEIKYIECKNNFNVCRVDTEKSLDSVKGKSLRSAKRSLDKILSSDIRIVDYSVRYKFPDSLDVYLLEAKPKFALKMEGEEKYALVSDEGVVLKIQEENTLPYLSVEGQLPEIGEKASKRHFKWLNIVYSASKVFALDNAEAKDNFLKITVEGNKEVVFPPDGDEELLVGSMILIVKQLNVGSENTRIKQTDCDNGCIIDLRFNNPVIKFK